MLHRCLLNKTYIPDDIYNKFIPKRNLRINANAIIQNEHNICECLDEHIFDLIILSWKIIIIDFFIM